ncbi:MAG: hypothetical protein K6T34_04220 [Thermoflavifilum sp.]|nr:hypothetical protein [Thermoflavifilum sp.]
MRWQIFIAFVLISCYFPGWAQQSAIVAEAKQLIAQMKEEEALKLYQRAIAEQPHNAQLLADASLLASHLARITSADARKNVLIGLAELYADSALHLSPQLPEAQLAAAEASFQRALKAGMKEKINGWKISLARVQQVIQADSTSAAAWNLLGRIQQQLASMSVVERSAVKLLFGQLPNISMSDAINSFKRCMQLDRRMISNYYDLASALHANGQDEQAIRIARMALQLKSIRQGDDMWKQRCEALIKSLQ